MLPWALLAVALAGPVPPERGGAGWKTVETEHFAVHYPASEEEGRVGAEQTALRVAQAAEPLWLRLSDETGFFVRERVHVVVVDHPDDLVGYALPSHDLVVLSAQPGPQMHRLRGQADWVWDALAHELGHLWTHKAAGSLSEAVGRVEVGGVFETSGAALGARVQLGAPRPMWWSEGGAEYLSERAGVNRWTAARDMTLRAAVLEDRLLSWAELQTGRVQRTQADGERGYQQGYAFARWLDDRFGPGTFDAIGQLASTRYRPDWDRLIRQVTGLPAAQVYAEHLDDLRARYAAQRQERVEAGIAEGRELRTVQAPWEADDLRIRDAFALRPQRHQHRAREASGAWNLGPRISGDGRLLAEHRSGWVRVTQVDEARLPALGGRPDPAGSPGATTWLPAAFGHGFDFVPGADQLVLVASRDQVRSSPLRYQRPEDGYNRLWVVDLASGDGALPRVLEGGALRRRIRPIPGTERAMDPAVSPDGSQVAWLRYRDGTVNLVVSRLEDGAQRALTAFDDGTWMQGPAWSPDGRRLVVAMVRHHQSNLWTVDLQTGELRPLTDDRFEVFDPHWAEDGLYFAADLDGFYDLFRLDPDGGGVARITRVLGGAMSPTVTPGGSLLHSSYTAYGWKTAGLPRDEWLQEPVPTGPDGFRVLPGPEVGEASLAFARPLPALSSRPYRAARSLAAVTGGPILRVDGTVDGPRVLGGGHLRVSDARRVHTLRLLGVTGDDRFAGAAWTWQAGRPTLRLWAEHERAAWWRAEPGDHRQVRTVDQAGLTATWPWSDRISLVGEGRVRSAGAPVGPPRLRSVRATGGLVVGRLEALQGVGASGAAADLGLTAGWSEVDGSSYAFRQVRARLGAVAPLGSSGAMRRHRLELGLGLAATDTDLHPLEELRAGGDHPYAWRLGALEPTWAFPGYPPYALAGEALALGTLGYRLPLGGPIGRRVGPVLLDRLEGRLATDVGQVWAADGWVPVAPARGPALLADVVGEVRASAVLTEAPFDGFIRVAWPLVPLDVGPQAEPVVPDPARGGTGPRVYLGVGTGW